MTAALQVVVYCGLILAASLAGGWIPVVARLTHTRTQLLMSFVAGLMLGVGVFHMLPHATQMTHSIDRAVWWTMVGLLVMFFLQRFFHFHQHGPGDLASEVGTDAGELELAIVHRHDHDHDHDQAGCSHGHSQTHALNWLGVAIGLTVHTLMDGIALAASVEVEARDPLALGPFGLGTFLAIVLHKPLDAMAISSLMMAGGWSARARLLVNALFALVVPLGAALFYFGVRHVEGDQHVIVGCALAFSAGTFLCISLSDLLPEVQFHAHDRVKLSVALLLGITVAYAVGYLETSGHNHKGHGHEGHNHATRQAD